MSNDSPFLAREPIAVPTAIGLLQEGVIEIVGRMPSSSNATFLVNLTHHGFDAQAIYKPLGGERPLWDFPSGLFRREVAAFVLAQDLGWDIVPPTVIRHDAPFAEGSLQLFMPHDFSEHYFSLYEQSDKHHQTLRTICAFDLVINNTDRKSGHCLLGTDNRVWAIDHGVSFHHQFKLRTVLWDFAEESIPADLLADLGSFLERGIPSEVASLLNPVEVEALINRVTTVVNVGRFPRNTGERWPWPLI